MLPATPQAADGLERRAVTIAEVEAMQEQGIFHPDEKFELVAGRSSRCRPSRRSTN